MPVDKGTYKNTTYKVGDLLLIRDSHRTVSTAYALLILSMKEERTGYRAKGLYLDALAFWNDQNPRILTRMFALYVKQAYEHSK